jgi:hypothetical protein
MMQMFSPLIRKERYAMVQILTAFVVVVSMLFGGAGATVYAAQDSLPTDTLYPVKTLSEDMMLVLVNDPQSRLDLVLGYTNRRVEEILAVMAAGDTIPDEVIDRLQSELDMTLEIAAELEDPELSEAVTKIKIYIRDQDRLMGMTNVPDHAENERVRAKIQWQHQVISDELGENPPPYPHNLNFRNRLQNMAVISDTLPISTTETISDTQGIMMEGPGPAAGPGPGEPFTEPPGPGSDQGLGPYAGPGSDSETAPPGPDAGADLQFGPAGPYGPPPPVVTQEPANPSTVPTKEGSGNGK